jgi:hypothetical protein
MKSSPRRFTIKSKDFCTRRYAGEYDSRRCGLSSPKLNAVLPIGMIAAGWRIAVTDHARAVIQPATVQPAAKFKKPIHGHR